VNRRIIDDTILSRDAMARPDEAPVSRRSREAAVMFAEVIGAAELQARAGDAAHGAIAACLDRAQTAVAGRTRVVKRFGSRLMLLADGADSAASAATVMQIALRAFPAAEANKLGLGIGFHHGPVIQDNADVFGDTVNVAARLVEQAAQGQILLADATAHLVQPPYRRSIRRLHPIRLKGFADELVLCEIVWRGDDAATFHPLGAPQAPARTTLELRYRNDKLVLRRAVEEISVGRGADCRIVVYGEFASRHHCTIERRHDHFVLIDRSTNGTYVTVEGEDEVSVRREEIALRKRGWISFGQRRGSAGGDVLEFVCD
jgi:adenylate cyclase